MMEEATKSSSAAGAAQDQQDQRQLSELDAIQDKIVEAVRVASEAMEHLSQPESLDEESIQQCFVQYLAIMKDVHEGLASRASWIKNYVPYNRDTQSLRHQVNVLELRLQVLKEEAARLGWREEEGGGGGEAAANGEHAGGEEGEGGVNMAVVDN